MGRKKWISKEPVQNKQMHSQGKAKWNIYSVYDSEKFKFHFPGVVIRWQRNRMGRPLSPHKFIERSFECWANSTKQLLNAGVRHQAPRKAAHSLRKEVGQNVKDKKRAKELGMETHPGEGVMKEEKFPNTRKPSHWHVCVEFWTLRGKHSHEEKKSTDYVPNRNPAEK